MAVIQVRGTDGLGHRKGGCHGSGHVPNLQAGAQRAHAGNEGKRSEVMSRCLLVQRCHFVKGN